MSAPGQAHHDEAPPSYLGDLFIALVSSPTTRDLPTNDPQRHPISGWNKHRAASYILLPLYADPAIEPLSFYCNSCHQWHELDSDMQAHIDSPVHTPQPPSHLTDDERACLFKKGVIFAGRPYSEVENRWYRQAIPTLPHRKEFTRECTEFATKTKSCLITELHHCRCLSIQYDVWSDRGKRRFIGVMCQALCDDKFYQCNLATIPVNVPKCDAKFIASELEHLLDECDLAPTACVTDTDSSEIEAAGILSNRQKGKGKPGLTWFPCICHLLNLVLKAFLKAGVVNLKPLKHLINALGHSTVFTAICRAAKKKRTKLAQPTKIRWASHAEMVQSIIDLRDELADFIGRSRAEPLVTTAIDLQPILAFFLTALKVFEGNEYGKLAEIRGTLIRFRADLAHVDDTWHGPAQAALAKLGGLLKKHDRALEPLCSIAARLNPSDDPLMLFETSQLSKVDENVMDGLTAFVKSSPVLPAPTFPSPLEARPKLTHADLVSFAKVRRPGNQPPPGSHDRLRGQWRQYNREAASLRMNPSIHLDALDYWLGKQDAWPELAGYAVSILARPVASTATERHFSQTVHIEGLRRVSLTPEHVQDLALLMSNQSIAETVIK
jgi:hypothetical protein